jgi:hypothetical protein
MDNEKVYSLFFSTVNNEDFLRRIIVHTINQRIQDFQDPLTNTMTLILTSPIQIMFCESGVLPFETSLLPVIPYSILTNEELLVFKDIIVSTSSANQKETMESSGQYTLYIHRNAVKANSTIASLLHSNNSSSAATNSSSSTSDSKKVKSSNTSTQSSSNRKNVLYISKKKALNIFVELMLNRESMRNNPNVCRVLCDIIIQRLMARMSIPSDIISEIIEKIHPKRICNHKSVTDMEGTKQMDCEGGESHDEDNSDYE